MHMSKISSCTLDLILFIYHSSNSPCLLYQFFFSLGSIPWHTSIRLFFFLKRFRIVIIFLNLFFILKMKQNKIKHLILFPLQVLPHLSTLLCSKTTCCPLFSYYSFSKLFQPGFCPHLSTKTPLRVTSDLWIKIQWPILCSHLTWLSLWHN